MKISLAYSPDTDDAFMVEALKNKSIDSRGFEFEFISDDIQALNEKAIQGIFDITAISIAAYPFIASKYAMLSSGASIGDNYGPKLVCSQANFSRFKNLDKINSMRIAIPGKQTSAFFAARDLLGDFMAQEMRFDQINLAIDNNSVDAGLLIHELQLNPESQGLAVLADLGQLWHKKYSLPLPLGANAIKRELGHEVMKELSELYLESIEWGLNNRRATINAALAATGRDLDDKESDRYITMYVNKDTVDMGDPVKTAVYKLLEIGNRHQLSPKFTLDPFTW
jgi:1,4-dihydroxy-6-naphthoate synthase